MGNNNSSRRRSHSHHHRSMSKLAKSVLKQSPIRVCYICRHGRCKRLVDMMISDNGNGIPHVVLGTTLPGARFQISHFVTDCATWTHEGLVVKGHTPNGLTILNLELLDRHLLSGTIEYRTKEGEGKKTFNVHVHLDAAARLMCTSGSLDSPKSQDVAKWSLDKACGSEEEDEEQGSKRWSDGLAKTL